MQNEKNWRLRENDKANLALPGEIYPYGYSPTYYHKRLLEPTTCKTPERIFAVDTGDLFGNFIPAGWIDEVLGVANRCHWHTFLFLTKNPKRMCDFTFSDNCWTGTTINSDKDKARVDALKTVNATVRYLSIEPLLGPVTFDLSGINWIIIGAQTGPNPLAPETTWVEQIFVQAKEKQIPIFTKSNLKPFIKECYQEYPVKAQKNLFYT